MAALLRTDEDDVDITEDELCRAVAKSKTSAPGDDGITYQVLRLLLKYPGNHLLKLYNLFFFTKDMCLVHGLQVPLCLFPSRTQISLDQYHLPPAFVKC